MKIMKTGQKTVVFKDDVDRPYYILQINGK
jgi:hypothetical protein